MSQPNVEVVLRAVTAFLEQGAEPCAECAAPDFEVLLPRNLLEGGDYKAHEGVKRAIANPSARAGAVRLFGRTVSEASAENAEMARQALEVACAVTSRRSTRSKAGVGTVTLRLAGPISSVPVAWLEIDVLRGDSYLRGNAVSRYLGIRTFHLSQVDVPVYAYESAISEGGVRKGVRRFERKSQVRRHKIVSEPDAGHLDPLLDDPAENRFLETVVPFLRSLTR